MVYSALIARGTQTNDCFLKQTVNDTVFVRVADVFNPPPLIDHTFYPGYEVVGDTISIAADSAACFEFEIRDTIFKSFLSVDYEVEVFDEVTDTWFILPIPFEDSIITANDTVIIGEICLTPGCELMDEFLRVIIEGKDTFDCNPVNWVYDTVYIDVTTPFNQTPVISHNLNGLSFEPGIPDVITVTPNGNPFCYDVILTDPDSLWADLTAEGVSAVFEDEFGNGNNATLELVGTNPLFIRVCWNPSCYDSGQEFVLRVCGKDTSRCGLTPEVCDSVLFRVDSCAITIQNVVTPNGDGINDTFLPFDTKGVQAYHMYIYDRWGAQIHDLANEPWDGSIRGGKQCSEGVYYWIVEYQFWSAQGEPLRERCAGNVTLMR